MSDTELDFEVGSAALTLDVVGYQYPERQAVGPRDWDANWLLVTLRLRERDHIHSVRDPCLTTFELARLVAWFDEIERHAEIFETWPMRDEGRLRSSLGFIEPVLSFECRSGSPTVLRVCLALAFLPPQPERFPHDLVDVNDDGEPRRVAFEARLTRAALRDVSERLRQWAQRFPVRR